MPRWPEHPERRPTVVTGASSGIGAATARTLAAAGHPVVLGARRVEVCEELAAELRGEGAEAVALPLDLADPDSIDRFGKGATEAFGAVEVLVSNAGDVLPTRAAETDPGTFARQVQVNLLGAQHLVARLVPPMVERRRGDVVFVTSDVVRRPRPRMSSYVTAKFGLEGLAEALQLELEGTGVRASVVRPGPTLSGQGSTWEPAEVDSIMQEWARHGLMRHDNYLRPKGVAAAVLAVLSTPRGTHLTLVEVQPEGTIRDQEERR